MANMAARTLGRMPTVVQPSFYGGFATGGHSSKKMRRCILLLLGLKMA